MNGSARGLRYGGRGRMIAAAIVMAALFALVPAGSALAAAPANDNFASAEVIGPALPDSTTGTNAEATEQAGEPDHSGNPGGASVWYSFTPSASGKVVVDLCGSDFDTIAGVYTGTAVNALTGITSNDDGCGGVGTGSKLVWDASMGTTYRIAVDGYDGVTGNVALLIDTAPPPANDAFLAPMSLSDANAVEIDDTNIAATDEPGEPDHAGDPGGASVWYEWTAPFTGTVTIDTCASAPDMQIGVYTGTSVDALTGVAAATSGCGDLALGARVRFKAQVGTTYRIAVDGANFGSGPVQGDFTLSLALFLSPPNDDFADAETLAGANDAASESNATASKQPGEPDHAGNAGGVSVWYRWTAPATGNLTIDLCGSDFDTLLGIYTGSAVAQLTQAGSNDDGCGDVNLGITQSKLTVPVTAGTPYRIAVDGFNGSGGGIDLDLSLATAPDTKITKQPKKKTSKRKATFEFNSPGHGDATFECKLDGAAFEECTSPQKYRNLKKGKHKFQVRASDDGLTDPSPARYSWKVTG